jgi:hypothetical protein
MSGGHPPFANRADCIPPPTSDKTPVPYAVIVTLTAPAPLADAPARQAVGDLLEQHLATARDAVDSGGQRVTALGHWSGVHPDGAILALILEAPDPDMAHRAAIDPITVLLHTEPPLRD